MLGLGLKMQQEFPERKLERGLLGAALVRALLRALFKFEGLMSVMHLGMCVCVCVCSVCNVCKSWNACNVCYVFDVCTVTCCLCAI